MLAFPAMLNAVAEMGDFSGDQPMRVLAVLALAMLLAGCEGDRIKQGKNPPQEQRAAFGLLA